jgi:hypothetical protein
MPFSVITLAAAGADTGPFDLYSDVDSYAVAFETGVSKSSLLAGYYTFFPIGATIIRVKSASALCTNFVNMEIITTTTTTTTAGPPVEYQIDNSATGTSGGACSSATTTSIVYAQPGYTVPIVGMFLYTNTGLTTPFVGSAGWRKLTGPLGTYAVEINSSGEITNYANC